MSNDEIQKMMDNNRLNSLISIFYENLPTMKIKTRNSKLDKKSHRELIKLKRGII